VRRSFRVLVHERTVNVRTACPCCRSGLQTPNARMPAERHTHTHTHTPVVSPAHRRCPDGRPFVQYRRVNNASYYYCASGSRQLTNDAVYPRSFYGIRGSRRFGPDATRRSRRPERTGTLRENVPYSIPRSRIYKLFFWGGAEGRINEIILKLVRWFC